MATFKVGQRVKRVSHPTTSANDTPMPIGATGTVLRPVDAVGCVRVRADSDGLSWGCMAYTLAPLTDPGADAFIERIKKLKVYDEPLVVKTKERA